MANKKMKKWSDLTSAQQSTLKKKWNRVQDVRRKAGRKPYTDVGKTAWYKAQGIDPELKKKGIVRATQRMKEIGRKYGQ